MQREVEHEILVRAAPRTVYRLVEDVANWPRLFPPTVFVDHLWRGDGEERLRIWATVGDGVKSWTSHRRSDPDALRIDFRQEEPFPPAAAMSGSWIVESAGPGTSRVRLLHGYRAVEDAPDSLTWLDEVVDRNSRAELAALKDGAERANDLAARTVTFEDTLRVDAPAEAVYAFLNEAQHWSARLPHVAEVELDETTPGIQRLRMHTRTKDGSTHTTESVRVCLPPHRIVYKQTHLPALMSLHIGSWELAEDGDGVTTATSRHTAVVDPANVTAVLGAGAGIAEARSYLRSALGGNSLATLEHAGRHAEAAL
ncbi:aromatase/cyclase [Streptomyces sp. HB2AG]|uniref:aromatase/cyclase n=1 Tax=Streptomyces sp. HB2AG TaxID=2983400 RepID=UPI0022AB000A|nr:aromatase/cyclase [Streptomyces sp. HB2AG]MCZ2526322.1 aromatase/cyclase [Streptomyces sp. HB2AG]